MPNAVEELLGQLIRGEDFHSVEAMLSDVTPQQAVQIPAGTNYSIGLQVKHMVYWTELWLDRIEGTIVPHDPKHDPDFVHIAEADWAQMRMRCLEAERRALAHAQSQNLSRNMNLPWSPESTVQTLLLQIALHNAYHLGQIAMLRQMMGLSV